MTILRRLVIALERIATALESPSFSSRTEREEREKEREKEREAEILIVDESVEWEREEEARLKATFSTLNP